MMLSSPRPERYAPVEYGLALFRLLGSGRTHWLRVIDTGVNPLFLLIET